jgi:hypothetical protein
MCRLHFTSSNSDSAPGNEHRSLEERADRHVRRLVGFYVHLAAYVGVNTMLVAVNLVTSPGVFWAVWPILGWGVKVVGHAVAVFGVPGYADWKDRVRRRYIRRHEDRPVAGLDEKADDPSGEAAQLRRRVENLEAIVTSVDWDLLADLDDDDPADERAATLAEETVPR